MSILITLFNEKNELEEKIVYLKAEIYIRTRKYYELIDMMKDSRKLIYKLMHAIENDFNDEVDPTLIKIVNELNKQRGELLITLHEIKKNIYARADIYNKLLDEKIQEIVDKTSPKLGNAYVRHATLEDIEPYFKHT